MKIFFSAAHNPPPERAKKGRAPRPQYRDSLARGGVASRPAAVPISRGFSSLRRLAPRWPRRGPPTPPSQPSPPQPETGPRPDGFRRHRRSSVRRHRASSEPTGARPNAVTPIPRALQRPPPPPSQQELRRRRQGQHVLPDAMQKTRKRKVSASPGAKNAPPPLYDLPVAATTSNNDDASMAEVGVDLFGASEQSFMDMIDTVEIDDMTVPLSFGSVNEDPIGSVNEDPIDISVPMSVGSINEDPIENHPVKKKKWARSANYSPEEDEALVMAWESVSLDPIIGTDQNTNTYWNHIYDHFHRNVKTPSIRTLGSLAHRWSAIQECCNRWAGCVEEIDRAPPSGATIEDRIKYCQKLYMQRDPKNKTFVMPHCWSLLQNNEKWTKRNTDCNPLHKKKSSTCSLGSVEGNEEEEETASPTANKRPPGRRQEKERAKKGGDHAAFQTAVQEMIASRKELEAAKKQDKESRWREMMALEERKIKIEEKKLDSKQLKQECKLMFMETSGLDETQKAFVQTMRTQIVVSKMGVNGSGVENNGA